MKANTILSALAAGVLAVSAVPSAQAQADSGTMRNMTTMDIIRDMGIGINLGNTFESCGDWIDQWGDGTPNAYETAWGSPTVTREMIQGYADAGFGVLRVPVAWSNMMKKDGSYTIDPAYMKRVTEVVDWALDSQLYVIVNLHWDGGWLEDLPTDHDNCMKKYTVIWEQVCENFKDYSDKLMFESQNEELGWNSLWNQWSGSTAGKAESYGFVNEVNQKFVDTVRSSGGNNDKRHLLISGYNTDITLTCDEMFRMPSDPADRCALSVHYYTPAGFALLTEDASWAKFSATWGTDADYRELDRYMDMLEDRYSSKGVPVIIGEYGCPTENKEKASVERFISSVCEAALSRGGICPVLWDTTGQHYDRKNCRMTDSTLNSMMIQVRDKYVPKTVSPEKVRGDVNGDGSFSLDDLVAMQKFLLGSGSLSDGESGDLNGDGKVSVFDLILMKQLYTE